VTQYVVVIEEAESNFSAYVPDLPGCVAAADTKEEILALMREAIAMHVEALQNDGLPIPSPSSSAEYLTV
jgi:predicted RNase H-like HicB family nuclease